jgi:tight adherence protein B
MLMALLVFFAVMALVLGGAMAMTRLPARVERRRVERRLREVREPDDRPEGTTVVAAVAQGPVPALDRYVAGTAAGTRFGRLIQQSGVRTTPSAMALASLACAGVLALVAGVLVRMPIAIALAGAVGLAMPLAWLAHRRTARLKKFEEQFPEALDLLSRAIRAGHAFQAAMGMVADEVPAPVGAEFKNTFERQNFGLPLGDTMNELAERVPLLDVRFFVTAVAIQRETGGNLAEILDNLANVVRERFKILRQVRVHTAHGRFTGYVLLALPAALAVVLSFINMEHMRPLFQERMGHLMVTGAIVMQAIGFVWIRKVIRIEV